jgi:hypothetical protein
LINNFELIWIRKFSYFEEKYLFELIFDPQSLGSNFWHSEILVTKPYGASDPFAFLISVNIVSNPKSNPQSMVEYNFFSKITFLRFKLFWSKISFSIHKYPFFNHALVAPKHHKPKKYHRSDKMSSITEKGQMESTSDEGFNSGGQTTNSTPDVSQKKQRRRKQRRRENKKDGTESRSTSQSRTSKSSDEYLTRI